MFNTKCSICEWDLRFIKMKFNGGYVCKKCYSTVSRNFTETITKKNYDDLMNIYNSHKDNNYDIGEFQITRKIADLILFDDNHKLICLPNNRRISHKDLNPEILSYKEIVNCELKLDNKTFNDDSLLINKINDDKNKTINNLEVKIVFKNSNPSFRSINIISTPVRISSFAYKKSFEFAKSIVNELNTIVSLSN